MIGVIVRRVKAAIRNERATSPTIGSVLLVGVTVVLATTVGVQMYGFSDTRQKPFAIATVDYEADDDQVMVTWRGNTNAETLRITARVGDQHRTVTLNQIGHRMTVDSSGLTVRKDTVVHWDHPSATDGDRVSVTVIAVKNGETTVLTKRTATI